MDQPLEPPSLPRHFAALTDPRQLVKVLYPLPEILLLVLCGTIVGADDFVELEQWSETHIDFPRRFPPYRNGIPSHDALNDLMNALDHKLFYECFVTWVNGLPAMARSSGAPMPDQRDVRHRTWSPPGRHVSCSARKPPTPSPTRPVPAR